MSGMVIEAMGWVGAFAVLAAYALLSARKLASDSYAYHNANIVGALLLAVYAFAKDAFASMFINVVWVFIGVFAVVGVYRASMSARAGQGSNDA